MPFAITLDCQLGRRVWSRYVKVNASSKRRAIRLAIRLAKAKADNVRIDRILELPSELPSALANVRLA